MIAWEVKDDGVAAMLGRVALGTARPRPLMRAIAGLFEHETEENFAAQGRPAWLGLKPATLAKRGADARILQDTGQLAASVSTNYGDDFAAIGSNKPYAAIHQLGGQTRPHEIRPVHGKALRFNGRYARKVAHPGSKIPARPFLPFDAWGGLRPSARLGVESLVNRYLQSLVGPTR